MSWAKLDDQFHSHRKAKRAWRGHPRALGLHLLAMSYCAGQLTDGLVDDEFVEEKIPKAAERAAATSALVEAGLWDRESDGWRIHDWLLYNASREDTLAKRRKDADRKARGRDAQSEGTPPGLQAESDGPTPSTPIPAVPLEQREWGASAPEHVDGERLEAVVAVLRTAPRLTFDPLLAGVANTMAAFPKADHVQAAHVAVSNVADPNYRTTDAAKALRYAISDLERQQRPRGSTTAAERRSEHDRLQDERRETALRVLRDQSDEGKAA